MSLRRSLALALASVSFVSSAWASPHVLKPGESYSELSLGLTSAESYFRDSDSKSWTLGGTFEQRVLRSHNELGWHKHTSVWLDLPVVSRTYARSTGATSTATGLGDLGLGVRIALKRGGMPISLSLGWTAPMGGNRRLFPGTSGGTGLDGTRYGTAATANGQKQNFFDAGLQSLSASLAVGGTLGSHAYYALGTGWMTRYLTIGATSTTDRFANFLNTDATLGVWCSPRLLLDGTYHGTSQVAQGDAYDRILGNIKDEHKTSFATIGARATYRVDDKLDVFAGGQFTISGRNALVANTWYAGMAWKQTSLSRLAGAFGNTKP
jgi:hypothetical protein